jgi:histidinol-phosphate aminotransferase
MFSLENILRENIKKLTPYSSARDEFKGNADVFLDANENAFGSPIEEKYNRYPDSFQLALKKKISSVKGLLPDSIFLGNGSDEVIDLLFRAFCRPGIDNVIICPPTYGMYEVSANINDVFVKKVALTSEFQPDLESISEVVDEHTKMIFLCSPNNPTGNSMNREEVEIILNNFDGLVVIDEAYINYSRQRSFIAELTEYPNLVVLQTLSKAWGLAGIRVGMAFASPEIVDVLTRIKPPYNISEPSQQMAIRALEQVDKVNQWIRTTVNEREALAKRLSGLTFVQRVYPSDANFLLVKMDNPKAVYDYLVQKGVIVRDRSKVSMCEGCLRITVGTPGENEKLVSLLLVYPS